MQKMNVIKWFVRLVRRDMQDYTEEPKIKESIYSEVKGKLKEEIKE